MVCLIREDTKKDLWYHDQDNADVSHQYVRMYCNTNQFPTLSFCGQNSKPHDARGLSKHHHIRFYPKLGIGICAMCHITRACVACTPVL